MSIQPHSQPLPGDYIPSTTPLSFSSYQINYPQIQPHNNYPTLKRVSQSLTPSPIVFKKTNFTSVSNPPHSLSSNNNISPVVTPFKISGFGISNNNNTDIPLEQPLPLKNINLSNIFSYRPDTSNSLINTISKRSPPKKKMTNVYTRVEPVPIKPLSLNSIFSSSAMSIDTISTNKEEAGIVTSDAIQNNDHENLISTQSKRIKCTLFDYVDKCEDLIIHGYLKDECPITSPVDFDSFLDRLDAIPSRTKVNEYQSQINPLSWYNYADAKSIYMEGMKALTSSLFLNKVDAIMAIEVVVKRAFIRASTTPKNPSDDDVTITCSKKQPSERVVMSQIIKSYFVEDFDCQDSSCTWNAFFKKDPQTKCFYFYKISPIAHHCTQCFTGKVYRSRNLTKHAIEKKEAGLLESFNKKLNIKTGLSVSEQAINKHLEYMHAAKTRERIKYIDIYNNEPNKDYELKLDEDREIAGLFIHKYKTEDNFTYHCSVSNDKELEFIVSMNSSQREALSKYGDLLFIDSTFCLNRDNYNAINICVINGDYKSMIVACAFVKREDTASYLRLLTFIKCSVVFNRLPLCVICDGALQIHSAVATIFPYARHVYCAFHSMRGKIFAKDLTLPQETKDDIRETIRTMLSTDSMIELYNCINKLLNIAANAENVNIKKRILEICAHAINASRPYQSIFSCDTISSSRVESMNAYLKRHGLNKNLPLFNSLQEILRLIEKQSIDYTEVDNRVWKYASDPEFIACFTPNPKNGIELFTNKVLESMYSEFCLTKGNTYQIIPKNLWEFEVQYKGNNLVANMNLNHNQISTQMANKEHVLPPLNNNERNSNDNALTNTNESLQHSIIKPNQPPNEKHKSTYAMRVERYTLNKKKEKPKSKSEPKTYDKYIVKYVDNKYKCNCSARMGHPCRHIFAAIKFSVIKLTKNDVNTRFWLKDDDVDWMKINMDAFLYMVEEQRKTNECFGSLLSEIKYANVLLNAGGEDNLTRAFLQDLAYFTAKRNKEDKNLKPYLGEYTIDIQKTLTQVTIGFKINLLDHTSKVIPKTSSRRKINKQTDISQPSILEPPLFTKSHTMGQLNTHHTSRITSCSPPPSIKPIKSSTRSFSCPPPSTLTLPSSLNNEGKIEGNEITKWLKDLPKETLCELHKECISLASETLSVDKHAELISNVLKLLPSKESTNILSKTILFRVNGIKNSSIPSDNK